MEHTVRFGTYQFELDSGRLWRGTGEVRLTPKAAAVLKALVGRAGAPVSREELFASVWSGLAVSDDALTSCIQELRKALADDPRQPQFIETRHRRGYRFIAPLSDAGPEAADQSRPAQDSGGISTIAVLPFADLSPGHDQEYLCAGLAEELLNALTHIDGLRVAARIASFQFRSASADLRDIGHQLSVEALLDGSVRKAGDRLRVAIQLVDVRTGYHLWSERFDRTLDDVFAIQDQIAQTVATLLRGGVLSGREKRGLLRPHTGAEAYEYYLRARQDLPRMTRPDLENSAANFQRAIDLDASYGPAFAGLAMVHATLYEWFGARDEDLAAAEHASQRALDLAPGLAEAHVARGCAFALSRRYGDAAGEFEAAIRLNPNLFDAYYYFARTMFAAGEIAQSAELFRNAAAVRQEDFQSPILMAQAFRMLGRTAEAEEADREGIRRAEHVLVLNPRDGRALSIGSVALFGDGQVVRALEWSDRSLELYPEDTSSLINGACVRARSGQHERALELLERVFGRGWGKRDWIEHDPDYDALRGDPRFQRLLAKLK
jgi:adenylate cyclase